MANAADERVARYSRQTLFAPIGPDGQKQLSRARVAVVGCGALGSVQSEMLTRAGVGYLTVIDRDYLDWTNLQRQSLFSEDDVRDRLPKAVAAVRRLQAVNSDVSVVAVVDDLHACNAVERLRGHDLLLDGTDNFETRLLINEVAHQNDIPWIYGACVGSYAMTATFLPSRNPCFHCLLGETPLGGVLPTCDTAGIIAPAVHWAASIQVAEALKILAGKVNDLHRSLMTWDVWSCRYQRISLHGAASGGCPVCEGRSFPILEGKGGTSSSVLCGRNAVMLRISGAGRPSLSDLAKKLNRLVPVVCNEYLLSTVIDGLELVVFADGRSIVRGTHDEKVARTLYAKYVGM